MYTADFWKRALERAIKTAAQSILVVLTLDGVFSLMSADLNAVLIAAGSGALFSILTSIVSAPVGDKGTPSLISS